MRESKISEIPKKYVFVRLCEDLLDNVFFHPPQPVVA